MVPTKFVATVPPVTNLRLHTMEQFKRVQLSTDSIIALIGGVTAPIELGDPDSGGTGYTLLRIPNP